MESLLKNLVLLIANKLNDRDILSLSRVNKRYNDIIKRNFKQYYAVFTEYYDLILLIENTHQDFRKIVSRKKIEYYRYNRFLVPYINQSVWIMTYCFSWMDRKRWKSTNYFGLYPDCCTAKNNLINQWQKEFDLTEKFINDINKSLELPQKNSNVEKYSVVDRSWHSVFKATILKLNTSSTFDLAMAGHWNELLGKKISAQFMNELMAKNLHYKTLDNGSRPFVVICIKTNVVVYYKETYNTKCYYPVVANYRNVARVLPGICPHSPNDIGNSVLLDLGNNLYVFIGDKVYQFCTPGGDIITKYHSLIGNNGVPYPIAESTNNIYSMSDFEYVNKSKFVNFNDWPKAYSEYSESDAIPMPQFRIIRERVV